MNRSEALILIHDLAKHHQTQSPGRPNPHLSALNNAVRYFDQKGMLELWTGVEAMKGFKWNRASHQKNREAEESHIRKKLWGWEEKDDDMKDESTVHFGDVHNTAKAHPFGLWTLLAAIALALVLLFVSFLGLIGIAAAGLYWMTANDPVITDETVQIGLGRIEDYLKPEKETDGE